MEIIESNCAEDAEFKEKLKAQAHLLQLSGAAGGGTFRSGWSALTTMLIFGLNSASYCTQSAATAASCIVNDKHCQCPFQNGSIKHFYVYQCLHVGVCTHTHVCVCVCV